MAENVYVLQLSRACMLHSINTESLFCYFQMNVLIHDKSQTLYLQNGVVLHHSLSGVASIELSGFISISLWNQDAHSVIKNRCVQ